MKSINKFFDPYDFSPLLINICREEMRLMGDNRYYIRFEIDKNITDHILFITNIKLDIMRADIKSYLYGTPPLLK
jgi:hypothetical protein